MEGLTQASGRGGFDPANMRFVPLEEADGPDQPGSNSRAGWPDVTEAAALGRMARIGLRSWSMADLPRFHALLDNAELWRFMPSPYPDPLTPDAAQELLTLSIESPHHDVMAVLWDGVPAGQVRLEFDGAETAEISYWIGQTFWGQGIAQLAVQTCLRQVPQRHPHITRVTARVHEDNPASHVVVLRAGLSRTGTDSAAPDWVWYARDV